MQATESYVLIAANPKSGASSGRAKVGQLRDALSSDGLEVEICESLAMLGSRSYELAESRQLRAVVSAGGDGTAAAVVNIIPPSVPMVILPLGTENLLAKHLGVTGEVAQALQTVRHGQVIKLDAGSAEGRIFLIMLSCGFDAEVVRQLHGSRRGHISRWSYTKPIWQAVRNYAYPPIDVECEFDHSEGTELNPLRFSTAWLFAFNLPRYAANLRFCPQACGNDGCLDLCAFARGGCLQGFEYLFHLWLGSHQQHKDFRHVKARRFRLSSHGTVPYQIDGDPGGMLPLEVEVLPERLMLLVPSCP